MRVQCILDLCENVKPNILHYPIVTPLLQKSPLMKILIQNLRSFGVKFWDVVSFPYPRKLEMCMSEAISL